MRHLILLICYAARVVQVLHAQSLPPTAYHWPLDELTGSQAADIAGGEHGQLQGGVSWNPAGRYGGALQFNGADGRVVLGPCDLTTGPGGITLSLWMKAGLMAGNEQVLLAKTDGPGSNGFIWSLSQVNSTAIRFRVRAGGTVTELTTPGSSLFSGSWYHVCGTYNGSEMRIYLNGALMAFTAAGGTVPFAPSAPASMGARSDGSAWFLGSLDDVRIYDQGLSDMDVFELVLGNVSVGTPEGAVIRFDEAGRVIPPPGTWEWMRVVDVAGRLVHEQRIISQGAPIAPTWPGSGLFVITLGAGERRVSVRSSRP